jgi:hypothetical protein
LDYLEVDEGEPLINMENKDDDMRIETQEIQDESKPKAPKISLRKFQFILS